MRNLRPDIGRAVAACLLLLIALGCNAARGTDTLSMTPESGPLITDNWQSVAPGIERRDMTVELGGGSQARAALVRLDPSVVIFRSHYSPGAPHTLAEWRDLLPQASVIVNGAFFDDEDRALGLLVSEGQVFGSSFAEFGGMFQVTAEGPRVRSLVSEPYQGETLAQAVQGFPVLLEAGGIMARQSDGFDRRARRTVIGQDWTGRIIVAVFPHSGISFAELQTWLLGSDLNLYIALALDGGRSSGLVINTPARGESYPSLDGVPSVIAVYGS